MQGGMPRKARIDAPGALHHLIVRGIERKDVFQDNADRDFFVERLGQISIDTHTDCIDRGKVTRAGRYPETVEARSVLCYWAARELGVSTLELSKRLGISQSTASQSVKRGEKVVVDKKLNLMG
jgi:hypothetical protein